MMTETELAGASTSALRERRDRLTAADAAELEQVTRELQARWVELTPKKQQVPVIGPDGEEKTETRVFRPTPGIL